MSGKKDSYIPEGLFKISRESEMKMENSYFKFGTGSINMFSQIFSKTNLESMKQPMDNEKEKKEKKDTEINRLCVMYGC
ncbi:Hypothetical protein SRAE_2000424600 [Strongyloides ratti]|uniref:Uncharacterized protein n=1 Tax=Strongyloides ratti TaxID=34506 RepID=A0A090LIN0_STRRB|nr:Hypothetical protein SRAE_2000424600 [Strongyloides ratti]CEF69598.1 Hypothetical protein SRAE_2000424600 [Strongyloides ratti]